MQLAGNRSLDGFLAHFRAPSVGCPRCRRHETGPSTTFKPDPSTIPRFPENRRPSTCGFIFARDAMVGGCRPNVVDGPVSWREAPGAAGVEPDGRAAAAPPSRGARPAGSAGHRGARRPGRAPASAPWALVTAVATPRDTGARPPGKFFQNCPCIVIRVPV